ncbi:hypothetical protein KC331_g19021, partial [Hortaea werneckii]
MHMSMARILGILVALIALTVSAKKKDKPSVEETKFDSPQNLFYFEDSDVVLVTDTSERIA